ncbi:hypothetical protein AVEN_137876-1 [Araneus ventricosus]|uniref:Uncharacterized protein n=1 Tax=Araneus ventricosus TaxID=182803 RepID=A0A4Y2RV26_ARAVE|nr:hypothetical protein AVEN_94641-1 [Araneus ventricosus]GBN78815.1 hypothetical protein AVEN_145232-1 [Araneus ventricosus]GBN83228.1 hypothetical protein AVEN_263241-1 [Araneus ventricosus]GBN83229.1 hypothetical protein AVEN_137876-1 [Araneus ventricosus]
MSHTAQEEGVFEEDACFALPVGGFFLFVVESLIRQRANWAWKSSTHLERRINAVSQRLCEELSHRTERKTKELSHRTERKTKELVHRMERKTKELSHRTGILRG